MLSYFVLFSDFLKASFKTMGQCARMVSLYISFVLNKLSLLIDPVELQALSSRKLKLKIDQ